MLDAFEQSDEQHEPGGKTEEAAEDERPTERTNEEAGVARMTNRSVNIFGDEAMVFLNRQEDAEEASQINEGPDANRHARDEERQPRVAQSVRFRQHERVVMIEIWNEEVANDESNLQPEQRAPLPAHSTQPAI